MLRESLLPISEIKDALTCNLINKTKGKVVAIRGPIIIARMPSAALGDICEIEIRGGNRLQAHVISFQEDLISLAPVGDMSGISPGSSIINKGRAASLNGAYIRSGEILDAQGIPLIPNDNVKSLDSNNNLSLELFARPPSPIERKPIRDILTTGIRSLDALCTIGYGQRIGLFAGAGVGKSTLLGMIARNAVVDITIIALVGERGREVNEFIQNSLGLAGLKRSILVVATSDETPLKRSLAPITATAIAEYYRDQGKKVLLLVDSLTRTARAIRDVSLASGDLPIRQGLTSSVYTELPKLIERAGNNRRGSITSIYTILDTGEHELDPLAEELKSLLDGHIILDSKLAQQGIRPAIDFSRSISRLFTSLHGSEHIKNSQKIIHMISRLKRDKNILLMGGTPDDELKTMLSLEPLLNSFLNQGVNDVSGLRESLERCKSLTAPS